MGEPEHGEAREVDCGGEQGEVGVDVGGSPDSRAAPAVAAAHEVRDFALDLGSRGGIVGLPVRVGLAGAGAGGLLLVGGRAGAPKYLSRPY